MTRTLPWLWVVALVTLSAHAEQTADPCGGLRFVNGRVELGRPLAPKGPETEACLKHVAQALVSRPAIRSVTLAARLPDAERLDGQGLAVAKAAAEVLVSAGVPRTRVSVVAPPAVPGESGRLQLAYVERPAQPRVAQVRASSGQVSAGPSPAELRPRGTGDSLYTQELFHTAPDASAELELADASRVRVTPNSLVRLGAIELGATGKRVVRLELMRGSIETMAAPGGDGSVFEVRTRGAVAGVRGTQFRVSAQEDGASRLETLEGKVALGSDKAEVEVVHGQGSRVLPGAAPEPPRPLLAAPLLNGPRGGSFTTAPTLEWFSVPGAKTYRVELARTADFAAGVRTLDAQDVKLAVPAEATGKWFWRVLAVDSDGFIGFPSKIFAFDLRP
ncbi:FecR family protein [Myxococcus landrumensis]|uniref:FecR domain-containing protein n=1 Tax=Myxococcus landrumensis TaxID=2813577 RepID=A0ABX7NB48_9BACT|nr:FecR family protein [Myxococcus landrumus]QSQ16004.1 FecR domain-containing protein [Myxococcus landrumus]